MLFTGISKKWHIKNRNTEPMRFLVIVLASILLGLLLTSCSRPESNVALGNQQGYLHYGNGAEPQGLDPHVVTGVPENHIVRAIFEGLAVKNPITLEPEPGVAEKWKISEDGRIYTFYINPNAKWSNGEHMTASDYVWSWNRALHPETGSLYSYMLYPIVNAEAYAKGEITDFSEVGVKSIDENTLEVTLNAPTPYFLQLMDHYSTFAVHPETLLKYGKMTDRFTAWTRVGNLVGNGAFTLDEWSINRRIIVKKNEFYWDRDRVSLEGVYFYPTENAISEVEPCWRTSPSMVSVMSSACGSGTSAASTSGPSGANVSKPLATLHGLPPFLASAWRSRAVMSRPTA